MLFLKIFFLIELCFGEDFDNSILRVPPWKVTDCQYKNESFCDGAGFIDAENAVFDTCENLDNCTINVAVVLPNTTSHIVNLGKVQNLISNMSNSRIKINISNPSYIDDKCKQEFATLGLTPVSNNHSHVLFGPICDYCLASVSRVAKYMGYYGLPVITSGGFTYAFSETKTSCSDEYFMSINVGPTDFTSFGEFFYLIMNRYKWKKISLMYEKSQQTEVAGENTCQFIMESVVQEVTNRGKIDYQDADLELIQQKNINYTEYLKELVGVNYGIILTCTSHDNIRKFAIDAYNMNMTSSGEYVFFNFETYNNSPDPFRPWNDEKDSENNEMAKKAFRSIYTFMPIDEANFAKVEAQKERGSIYLDAMSDALLLYSSAIQKSLDNKNGTPKGIDLIRNMMGTEFEGLNGKVIMNCNGQRVREYALLQMNDQGEYSIGAKYSTRNKTITDWSIKWLWTNGDPLDTPKCGYDNSRCRKLPENPSHENEIILLTSLILVVCAGILIVGVILYRHFKLKSEIYSMAWKVNYDDIVFLPDKPRSSFQSSSSFRKGSQAFTILDGFDGLSVAGDKQLYTVVGFYKAIRVAVKSLQGVKLELNRQQLIDLKLMKDLSHDNLVKFYGACLDIPNCILSEYCPKGSLQDILENDNVKIDMTFKMSLIMDIVRGMQYLHNSAIKSHGALKSTNCLVDSRFVLKITDFGLHFLRKYTHDGDNTEESHSYWQRQLWTAPEILRMENPTPGGTQKGDIYSFAIIMHEIIERQGPFHLDVFRTAKEKPTMQLHEISFDCGMCN